MKLLDETIDTGLRRLDLAWKYFENTYDSNDDLKSS